MSIFPGKTLKAIAKELNELTQTPPEDIQVIPAEANLAMISAWIRGPDGTPYEGGYFKVTLELGTDYPTTPPKGFFKTKIFHPNVSSSGEICVNTLKKDWKPELGIKDILLTIKCLLIAPNAESALNEDAGKLLLDDYDDYAKRARLYTGIQAQGGKSEYLQLGSKENNTPFISKRKREDEESSSTTTTKPVVTVKKKKALRRL
ncbi:ubiquitin-conjugating enzyme E2 S-B [Mucor mucedo]|uniref:ubiquitin-conjugating enzyme E2 S-B n=1 Tax=Mucor mucedo TaxID=29922 RepID=UPI00221F0B0C|nr:ubiquitin-conjugating enzyme E2 S-B [Mucor mucedo]KAI7894502.1 ubiquitin-conjugating enzyme E2 S-B [Mucor mucedo]